MTAEITDLQGGYAKLGKIATLLKQGQPVQPISVRELLRWFGANRRGNRIVYQIKEALYDEDLRVEPNFDYAYIDGLVEFKLGRRKGEIFRFDEDEDLAAPAISPIQLTELCPIAADPTYRIGKLPSANRLPASVKPNESLKVAVTIMLANDFSQLPVMTNERDVKGVVSWASIGTRVAAGRECEEVRECMDDAHIISENTSLFDAIDTIVRHQYVLIQDATRKISGIVTSTDLSIAFRELAEPFLLIEEIEKHLRALVSRSGFTPDELLAAVQESRRGVVKSIFDLTLGDFISLLSRPGSWPKVQLSIDKGEFISMLEEVRQIRNDIMHFNPDAPSPGYLDPVRKAVGLLQKLQRARASKSEK